MSLISIGHYTISVEKNYTYDQINIMIMNSNLWSFEEEHAIK